MTINARMFPDVYKTLGIDTDELGCIMLDLKTFPVLSLVEDGENDLYFSPTREFVQGTVADHKAHATLLFGLLDKGSKITNLVDTVLEGWKKPRSVKILDIDVFPGQEEDGTEYSCIVAHLDPSDLEEANQRLRLLPHIDTFPVYRPHMTIAYIKSSATVEWLEQLSPLVGTVVKTGELNYGK